MSDRFTPIVAPDGITINLNRGLKGMVEGLIKRIPNGAAVLDGGLRKIIHRAVDENTDVPNQDFTAEQLAERIGLLRPKAKTRRRRA